MSSEAANTSASSLHSSVSPNSSAIAGSAEPYESDSERAYKEAFLTLGFSPTGARDLVKRFVPYKDEWPHEEPLSCALTALEFPGVPEPADYDWQLDATIEQYGFSAEAAHAFADRIRASGAPGHRRLGDWLHIFLEFAHAKPGHSGLAATANFGEPFSLGNSSGGQQVQVYGVRFPSIGSGTLWSQYANQLEENIIQLLRSDGLFRTRINALQTPLLLFHGTSDSVAADGRQSFAEHIRTCGIQLSEGNELRDFSDTGISPPHRRPEGGFYCSLQCSSAVLFALSDMANPSVLIYAISLDAFDTELPGAKHLNFYNPRDNPDREAYWQRVVRYYRNSRRGGFTEAEKDVLASYDYMRGPRADGREQQNYIGWREERVQYGSSAFRNATMNDPHHANNNEQLCVKSDRCAKLLDRHLLLIVFF